MVELCACVGLMWLLRFGSILKRPRSLLKEIPLFRDLLNCSLCLGFWTGLLIGLILYFYKENNIIYCLFPLASSGLCWFFDCLLELIQQKLVDSENK
jgi:hypothetical protein